MIEKNKRALWVRKGVLLLPVGLAAPASEMGQHTPVSSSGVPGTQAW